MGLIEQHKREKLFAEAVTKMEENFTSQRENTLVMLGASDFIPTFLPVTQNCTMNWTYLSNRLVKVNNARNALPTGGHKRRPSTLNSRV
jgi:hypothetical protein